MSKYFILSQVCQKALNLEDTEVKFMRKGKTGDWKNQFSEETIKAFQVWEEQGLLGSDLHFQYQL